MPQPSPVAYPSVAYIALGSNLGDRAGAIRAAAAALNGPETKVNRLSSFLENPAVGGPANSPPFLNAAAELSTTLGPLALLHRLLDIERQMGRVREIKWEPRVIDLDLLLLGDQIIRSPQLILPHPLMHQRRFVLQPLAEIAPAVIHPIFQKTISELLAHLSSQPAIDSNFK